ncbi:hypothetical protein HK102_005024, partial [Quaeritorhiza haematococci]
MDNLRLQLSQHEEEQRQNLIRKQLEQATKELERRVGKRHHLVGTKAVPGIFAKNQPQNQPSQQQKSPQHQEQPQPSSNTESMPEQLQHQHRTHRRSKKAERSEGKKEKSLRLTSHNAKKSKKPEDTIEYAESRSQTKVEAVESKVLDLDVVGEKREDGIQNLLSNTDTHTQPASHQDSQRYHLEHLILRITEQQLRRNPELEQWLAKNIRYSRRGAGVAQNGSDAYGEEQVSSRAKEQRPRSASAVPSHSRTHAAQSGKEGDGNGDEGVEGRPIDPQKRQAKVAKQQKKTFQ